MPLHETLLNTINQTWNQGIVPSPILRDDIVGFTAERAQQLFETRESELTIAEDRHGLTVVSCLEPAAESDTRTILAAQLAPDKNTLTLELHDRRQPAHFVVASGRVEGAWSCRAFELDLAGGGLRFFAPRVGRLGRDRIAHEAPMPQRQPYGTLYRALSAKALMKLIGAEKTEDVLSSPYARRKLMETHCAEDPLVQHPADAFLRPSMQQTIRDRLREV